jgi:hypothetical protein
VGEVMTRPIPFGHGRARTVPLAWGQRTTWDDMQHFLPEIKPFFVLSRRLPIPAGLSLDAVIGQLTVLMERHESLRSHYHADSKGTSPGALVQQVLPEGQVPLTIVDWTCEADADFDQTVKDAQHAIVTRRIDHAHEFPVIPCVVRRDGTAALFVLGISHVAADARAIDLVIAELAGLLDAAAAGKPTPPAWTSWQPADQVTYEQSPEGMLRNAAALQWMRAQLDATPPTVFGPPIPPAPALHETAAADGIAVPALVPAQPRFLCGRLESSAIPLALRVLARRYRTGTSAILLGATAALTRALTGTERCTFALVAANRTEPAAQYAITSLTQTALATLDIGTGTFADLMAAVVPAAAGAARHCMYDPRGAQELIRNVEARRAAPFEPPCRFNDMWAWTRKQPVHGLPDYEAVQAETATTTLSWPADQATDNDKVSLSINIYGLADRIAIDVLADTRLMPKPRLRMLLRGYENLLVELVTHDVSPGQIVNLIQERRPDSVPDARVPAM